MFRSNKNSDHDNVKKIKAEKMKKVTKDPYVSRVLREIAAQTVFGEIDEDTIYFSNYDLTVKAYVKEPEKVNGNLYISEMIFIVSHEYFDQPIEESLVGIGIDQDQTLASGATSFVECILEAIFNTFEAGDEAQIRNQIMGNMHIYKRVSTYDTFYMGTPEPNSKDMWKIVKEDIPMYLGTKKAYWLKLFASVSGGSIKCEARINNIVYPQLTSKLVKYAESWKNKQQFHSEKQFFLFIQEKNTFVPCDITRERVFDLTFKAIELFKQVNNEDTRNKAVNTIRMLAKDDILALEMCTFLPEIYAQKVMDLKEGDGIVAIVGEKHIPLMRSQLRTYGYIEDAVQRYIFHKKPSKEDNMKIMALSSKMQAIAEAVENGSKLQDLAFPETYFYAGEDYEVR